MISNKWGLIGHAMRRLWLVVGIGLVIPQSALRAELSPGDIAVIAYQSDDPDGVAFVTLVPISAGEVVRFTDNGWENDNTFRSGEGGIQYEFAISVPAGIVITRSGPFDTDGWSVNNAGLPSPSSFLLSTNGDQVFAFQGDGTSPTFVYGINSDSSGWIPSALTSNDTALPSTLTDGLTAVNLGLPERDNGYYNGTTFGTQAVILAAIGNPANWVTSDTLQTWPNWSFDLTSNFPAVTGVVVDGGPFAVSNSTTVTVTLSAAPEAGSPATISVSSSAFVSSANVVIANPDIQGSANVTFGTAGDHTAAASAVSHCTGSAISSSFNVSAPPTAPVAYAGPDRTLTINGGALAILLTDATATDANGLAGLTYEWTPVAGSGIVGWSNRSGAVTDPTSPAEAQVTVNATGIYTFTLTATDPSALAHADSVTISVINTPPIGQYDAPPNYYDPARPGGVWLLDGALKTALNNIISTGHIVRSYDSARQSLQLLDLDPANPNNVMLVYTGASVPKPWDSGNTWNREHLWPQSLFPGSSDMVSDLFNLRACDPVINSTRGNSPYGIGAGYWDPDHPAPDRGDCARSIFYDATRYMSEVNLVNGQPGANEMGDLAKLLEWHFTDPVNETERRRNHLIYSSVDNPSYHQSNRNPFIDHPELVWTIFSGSNNNSRLYVGGANPPTGASAVTVNLGRIIKNAPVPSAQATTLTKTGSHPTTYAISLAGSAVSTTAGPRQTFGGGFTTRSIDCGLATTTLTAGLKNGTITIDNTDVSSSSAGNGSADGNDVITVNLTVLEHANASFDFPADENILSLDLGTVTAGSSPPPVQFTIYNLMSVPGFTAAMDIDSISGMGDTGVLTTDLAPITNIPGSGSLTFAASVNTTSPGAFSATYTIVNSDENVPGEANGANLVLQLMAVVETPTCNAADTDCNATVDPADVLAFIDMLLNGTTPCSTCAGDLNADTQRDGRDIAAFVSALVIP